MGHLPGPQKNEPKMQENLGSRNLILYQGFTVPTDCVLVDLLEICTNICLRKLYCWWSNKVKISSWEMQSLQERGETL
jgi:hypothetical protein